MPATSTVFSTSISRRSRRTRSHTLRSFTTFWASHSRRRRARGWRRGGATRRATSMADTPTTPPNSASTSRNCETGSPSTRNDSAASWRPDPQARHREKGKGSMTIEIEKLSGGLAVEKDLVFPGKPDDPEMRESVSVWLFEENGAFAMPRTGIEAEASSWEDRRLQ